jgi:DNA-binding MarR family transcriptional regulator
MAEARGARDARDRTDDEVGRWSDELPVLDPLHEEVVVRIVRISRHLAAQASSGSATDGLVTWQFKTLLALRRGGRPYEASPSALAEVLDLSRGAVTTRLTWLEDLGLVSREHDDRDRRRVRVRLTPAGHEALEEVAGVLVRREAALFSGLSRREQQQLADLLRKVALATELPPPEEPRPVPTRPRGGRGSADHAAV